MNRIRTSVAALSFAVAPIVIAVVTAAPRVRI